MEGRVMAVAMSALGGVAPVAVKACSLTVLKRLATRTPAILSEINALIAEQLPQASAGLRARVRREFPDCVRS
jgi:hypothetical protein